jgi:signal transduction histidine kinase
MAEAASLAIAPRDLAGLACQTLADSFPPAAVVIFKVGADHSTAQVLYGVNLPPPWSAGPVSLAELPLVAAALQAPEQVLATTESRGWSVSTDGGLEQPMQSLCAAIPTSGGSNYALLFHGPYVAGETAAREVAIDTARRLLVSSALLGDTGRWPTLAAIHRAKLEWEHTADALPEIVGLLDRRRRVRRISRAVERWQLGGIQDAIGRDLHALLHASCDDTRCRLRAALAAASDELAGKEQTGFELQDPLLGMDLVVVLKAPAAAEATDPRIGAHRTVFTVTNVTSLRNAERELKALNQNLEQRVADRTADLVSINRLLRAEVQRRLEAEKLLQRSKRELELLSERLMSAQEAERKRISGDLHDSVGQTLSAIKYSLERAQLLARREASAIVDLAIARVQRLMDEVRTISMNLRPALLDDLGAASAVRSLCRDWQSVYNDIDVQADIAVEDADVPTVLVTNVFRAVQESLNNVARHAAARGVVVSMHILEGALAVTISDDGVGFEMNGENAPNIRSRGLRGLQERAESTGGRCEVSSARGRGTTVRLEWPLAVGQAARLANARVN